MMTVPWLVRWCLQLVRTGRASWSLVPVMALLVYAHSAVAVLSIGLLAVTIVVLVATAGLAGLRRVAARLAAIAAATVVVLSPLLVAAIRMGSSYDPLANVQRYGQDVAQQFVDPAWYLFDPSYRWMSAANTQPVLVQIDFALSVPLAAALVLSVYRLVARRTRPTREPAERATTALLGTSLALYLFLQLRISTFVYDAAGAPLKAISYPFRALTLVTPLALIATVVVADRLFGWALARYAEAAVRLARMAPLALCAGWFGSLVALSPLTAPLPAQPGTLGPVGTFLPIPLLTVGSTDSFKTDQLGWIFDDFLPVVDSGGHKLYSDIPIYSALHADGTEAQSLGAYPCTVSEPATTPFESLQLTFSVDCAGPTRLALPISFNSFTTVESTTAGGAPEVLRVIHVPTDPRIVVLVTEPGPETLTVHLPTLWSLLH
jgi:hypothetical protein